MPPGGGHNGRFWTGDSRAAGVWQQAVSRQDGRDIALPDCSHFGAGGGGELFMLSAVGHIALRCFMGLLYLQLDLCDCWEPLLLWPPAWGGPGQSGGWAGE